MASYRDKIVKGEQVTFKQLQALLVFRWLLTEDDVRLLTQWLNDKAQGADLGNVEDGPKAVAAGKKKPPAAKQQVASLFAKHGK